MKETKREMTKEKPEQTQSGLGQKAVGEGRTVQGIYDRVNVSVSTLNKVIIVLCILLAGCLVFGVSNRGYQVSFDTVGGTLVESQKRMYGELVEEPGPPTREGFVFDGWYLDEQAAIPWNMDENTVTDSMTLYAGWKER